MALPANLITQDFDVPNPWNKNNVIKVPAGWDPQRKVWVFKKPPGIDAALWSEMPKTYAGHPPSAPVAPANNGGNQGGGGYTPSFEMPEVDFAAIAREQQQAYQAALAKQQADAERAAGTKQRNDMYADRMSAAAASVDAVNAQINKERANARLLGIDYSITDEQKSARINDYFSTVWGEGAESQLNELFNTWGKPKGFEEFTIFRGTGETLTPETTASETAVSTSGTPRRALIDEDEDENALGAKTILGAL